MKLQDALNQSNYRSETHGICHDFMLLRGAATQGALFVAVIAEARDGPYADQICAKTYLVGYIGDGSINPLSKEADNDTVNEIDDRIAYYLSGHPLKIVLAEDGWQPVMEATA